MRAGYGSLAIDLEVGEQKSDAGGISRASLVGESLASINTRSIFFSLHIFKAQFTFIEHMVIVCLTLTSAFWK